MHYRIVHSGILLAAAFLFVGLVQAADKEHDITGTWKGHYKNSKGGGDEKSMLVVEEFKQGKDTYFKGHWDKAAIERGIKKGNHINWVHLDDKDNRVYTVKGIVSEDGKTIELEYSVKKKDGDKVEYTGKGIYKR